MWFASRKGGEAMIELALINIIYILFYSLIIVTIIAITLIIALAIIISKSK